MIHLKKKYPGQSTYLFSNNSPLSVKDVDGKDGVYYIEGDKIYMTSNIYFASSATEIPVPEKKVNDLQQHVNDRIKFAEEKGENTVNIDGKQYTVIMRVNFIYVEGDMMDAENKANDDIACGKVDPNSTNLAGVFPNAYVQKKANDKQAGHVTTNYKIIAFAKTSFGYNDDFKYTGLLDEVLHTLGMDHKKGNSDSPDDPNFGDFGNRVFGAFNPSKMDYDQMLKRGATLKYKDGSVKKVLELQTIDLPIKSKSISDLPVALPAK